MKQFLGGIVKGSICEEQVEGPPQRDIHIHTHTHIPEGIKEAVAMVAAASPTTRKQEGIYRLRMFICCVHVDVCVSENVRWCVMMIMEAQGQSRQRGKKYHHNTHTHTHKNNRQQATDTTDS